VKNFVTQAQELKTLLNVMTFEQLAFSPIAIRPTTLNAASCAASYVSR
jgi:hypothetical protein